MNQERILLWHEDLAREPLQAIITAFDVWGENESRLPTLSDIRRLCRDWRSRTAPSGPSECDAECKAAHGSGYDRNDVLWLMKQFLGKRLSHKDWKPLLAELNARREGGVPPAFRRET